MATEHANSTIPEIVRENPTFLYSPPLIVLAIGAAGVADWFLGYQVPFLELLYQLTPLSVVLSIVGIGGVIAQRYAFKLKETELEAKRERLEEELQEVRQAREENKQKRRRAFRLHDFPSEYEGEPLKGQTTDGYVVYAGDQRSDEVYVVEKLRGGDIKKVPSNVVQEIEEGLKDESIDWLEQPSE